MGRYQTKWGNCKSSKETYVDKIFKDAKKPERISPAPNKYNPDKISVTMAKSVSQKWNKEKRNSNIDAIMAYEKKRVGPNAYDTSAAYQQKVKGVYLGQNKMMSVGLLSEQEYAWKHDPAPNQYSYDPNVESKFDKVPSANLKRDVTVRSPERKKDSGPSPVSYPEKEKYWTNLSHQPKVPNYTIKKSKNDAFLDQIAKAKKYVPGVGTHKTPIEAFCLLARGPSPHYKRGR